MTREQKIIDLIILLSTNQRTRQLLGSKLSVADAKERQFVRRAYASTMSQYLELTRRLEELTEDYNPEENMYYSLIGGAL